jgi:hypothetical protein
MIQLMDFVFDWLVGSRYGYIMIQELSNIPPGFLRR